MSRILIFKSLLFVGGTVLLAVMFWQIGNLFGGWKSVSSCITENKVDEVRGDSLFPLIKNGSRVQIMYGFYSCNPVRDGDLVIYRYAGSKDPLIKIARAVAGDAFDLEQAKNGWNILVNGKILKNSEGVPYSISAARKNMLGLYISDYKGVIPAGAAMILGDRPEGTLDSTQFGLVGVNDILGRAELATN